MIFKLTMPPKNNTLLLPTCGVSNVVVKAKSPSVFCTSCRIWTHSKCTGLSKTEFTKLVNKITTKDSYGNVDPV